MSNRVSVTNEEISGVHDIDFNPFADQPDFLVETFRRKADEGRGLTARWDHSLTAGQSWKAALYFFGAQADPVVPIKWLIIYANGDESGELADAELPFESEVAARILGEAKDVRTLIISRGPIQIEIDINSEGPAEFFLAWPENGLPADRIAALIERTGRMKTPEAAEIAPRIIQAITPAIA